ncbi:hypothetical protein ACTHQN_00130 [Curtobacterium flaccumfaciens]|uniref:hypothetical protein n=1 Tax=Curtobacterium flaccumfaciens TaxID=2035 RepID=UPI003F81F98F
MPTSPARRAEDSSCQPRTVLPRSRRRALDEHERVTVERDRRWLNISFTYGLTLIGDGQQTNYPGGYTLGEVGISLSGRGVVLDVNHRNTAEILEFAKEMMADDQFVDIEASTGSATRCPTSRAPVRLRR